MGSCYGVPPVGTIIVLGNKVEIPNQPSVTESRRACSMWESMTRAEPEPEPEPEPAPLIEPRRFERVEPKPIQSSKWDEPLRGS